MLTILAIETSSELASAALLHGERVLTCENKGISNHSQTILPMVQELLKQAHIGLNECNAIACGAGPGSFTGVRTACGIAQGLAFGVDLPLIPVITLLAMAQSCYDIWGARNVLAVLDARMNEVYWAQYRYENGWQTVAEPQLSTVDAVKPDGDAVVCGNGLIAYATSFHRVAGKDAMKPDIMPHAVQVAKLAREAYAAGNIVAARDVEPLYLRNKVALTTAERMKRGGL